MPAGAGPAVEEPAEGLRVLRDLLARLGELLLQAADHHLEEPDLACGEARPLPVEPAVERGRIDLRPAVELRRPALVVGAGPSRLVLPTAGLPRCLQDLVEVGLVADRGALGAQLCFVAGGRLPAVGGPGCRGRHPHLNRFEENCKEAPRAILLGATNGWFPITLSVLAIPQTGSPLAQLIGDGWTFFEDVERVVALVKDEDDKASSSPAVKL